MADAMAGSGGIGASLTLKGWGRLERAFAAMPNQALMATSLSLTKTATRIFNESQFQVPFRRGVLSASGFVSPVSYLGMGQLQTKISYGGASAPYAHEQHYNLLYRHAPGRKALYLSDPVEAERPNIERRIMSDLGKALSGLGF